MPLKAKSQFYKWVSVYENHVQKKQQNNLLTVWRELCALTFPLMCLLQFMVVSCRKSSSNAKSPY